MQTSTTYATPEGVDPSQLDRHIAEMYHDVPNRFWVVASVSRRQLGEGFTNTTQTEEVSK